MTETIRSSSPLQPGLVPLVSPTMAGANTLYQLEYIDASGAGDLVIESGYTAADAAVYLRSLLALGVSPVTVKVIA